MRFFIAAFFITFSSTIFGEELNKSVSLSNLISNPDEYNNKKVRVIGAVRLEFEENAIYLTPNDLKKSNYKNGLWVNLSKKQSYQFMKYSEKTVSIQGTFSSKEKGHLGLWSGSIQNITVVEEYSKPK